MKRKKEKYCVCGGSRRSESEDVDSCFAGQNLALIRTWTTEQRRLEFASVMIEFFEPMRKNIDIPSPYSVYKTDHLRFYVYRIRHVMKELDGDILGIEIEERERIGGVFALGVKS